MKVIHSEKDLQTYLERNSEVSSDYPVVISDFIEGALEADIDAVADKGEVKLYAIASHVEKAGTHSGDATLVLPPHNLSDSQQAKILEIAKQMAKALNISGPFNSQLIVQGDNIKVIECNVRASRSLPFVSKVVGRDFIKTAAHIMAGEPYEVPPEKPINYIGVKCPQFSFPRLLGADPLLGVEMASTGEVASFEQVYRKRS